MDEEQLFAMLCRFEIPVDRVASLRDAMPHLATTTGLAIRLWSPDFRAQRPRLALCTTYLKQTPRAILDAVRDGTIQAEIPVMISNRRKCQGLAEEYGIPFECIGDEEGAADDERMTELLDQYEIDYVVLARYMRVFAREHVLAIRWRSHY